jgi:hypothetical protein
MTTVLKVIGVVILGVAAAVIWRVKPGVTSKLEPKQISTAAVEKTKESISKTSDPDIIHKTSLPLWIYLPPYRLVPGRFYSGLVTYLHTVSLWSCVPQS